MLRKMALGVMAVVGLALPAGAVAQSVPDAAKVRAELDAVVEALRKDVRTGKADVLGKSMELDSQQAAAFWPVYKEYETELESLGNERLAIIQDLAEHFDSMNDAKAKGLIERHLAFEEKRLALTKKYKDRLMAVLPAKTVARFLQVESRLNKLVDLAVASQIPLVY